MSTGRALELFFVDGNPDGMLTAEVFNWIGHVLRFPRLQLVDGIARAEASQTGVYILLGTDDGGPLAYIGEAEDMARCITQHARTKDWWNQVVLITTTGDQLNKAHVRHLESRLVALALDAGVMRLENGNSPGGSSLNEAATANMDSFLSTLNMVLPAIRVDLFQTGKRSNVGKQASPTSKAEGEQIFHLTVPRSKLKATTILEGGEMVVQAGSSVRTEWVGPRDERYYYWRHYERMVLDGTIKIEGGTAYLTENFAFSSPSAAAAVVSGRAANGRKSWKTPDGRTYADWEAAQISEANR